MKRTELCNILGIEYPIIQAPMNWITGANLAAAVSNAGGLGTIGPNAGAATITRDSAETSGRLRIQIRKAKSLTRKPFAVNFPIGIGGMRKFSDSCIEIAIEEEIQVAVTSVGGPRIYTERLKKAGIKVLHVVATVEHAVKSEAAGVDAVIPQGYEAGGHSGVDKLPTMVLVPQIVDAVKIPVIAAGGIADARGVVAALALGAEAVYMGTRFIATHECDAHPAFKQAVLDANESSTVSLCKRFGVGIMGRSLKNNFTAKFLSLEGSGASAEELAGLILTDSMHNSLVHGDLVNSEAPCGANAGMIKEIIGAGDVIQNIVAGVERIISNPNT